MKTVLFSVVFASMTAGAAMAAPVFTLTGGEDDAVPGGTSGSESGTPKNDVLEGLQLGTYNATEQRYNLGGYAGATVTLSENAKIKVDLLGWEAGYDNSFTMDGRTIGKDLDSLGSSGLSVADALLSFETAEQAAGVLDFTFTSKKSGGALHGAVSNSANAATGLNFIASFGPGAEDALSGSSLYLFFDDNVVSGDNHDDLVVRLSIVPEVAEAPLPASAFLLLSALTGTAAMRKRNRA